MTAAVRARREPSLASLQRWMAAAITDPAGAHAGVRSARARRHLRENFVIPSATLAPLERLGIYAGMYQMRLAGAVDEDYPALAHAIGHAAFHRLVHEYVHSTPSRCYNLNKYSLEFADFVERRPRLPNRALALDLVRLERAISESFSAERVEPLDPHGLARWTPEQWNAAKLEVNPSLRLLETRHAVSPYYYSVRAGSRPRKPAARRSWLAVYRKRDAVLRRPLSEAQFMILKALCDGKPLADALQAPLKKRKIAPAELARECGAWFRDWTAEGWFSGVRFGRRR